MRTFFLATTTEHANKELTVYEGERVTFREAAQQTLKAAGLLRDRFGIRKGDKVAIVSRNYPEWIIAFWAIHLLGGVSVCVNAWLPEKPLHHSISLAESKVLRILTII
jgi:acyl-CoA synthetase (AMP-forming)/AMP-acid ligase II